MTAIRETLMKSINRKQKGFSLIELLIVVAIILIMAAIAVPNYLRSRLVANEASAAQSVRTINTALITYTSTYQNVGFPATLGRTWRRSLLAWLLPQTLACWTRFSLRHQGRLLLCFHRRRLDSFGHLQHYRDAHYSWRCPANANSAPIRPASFVSSLAAQVATTRALRFNNQVLRPTSSHNPTQEAAARARVASPVLFVFPIPLPTASEHSAFLIRQPLPLLD